MKNILVTGASGLIGYGILKSIRKSKTPYNLIGTSIYDDSVALGFCDIFLKAPLSIDENYISWLVNTIQEYKVDLIIPGIESDVPIWRDHIDELKQYGVKVLLNDLELISLCNDKWTFYEILNKNKNSHVIPTSLSPNSYKLANKFGFPLLFKPRHGSASRGVVRVYDEESFIFEKKKDLSNSLIIQPIIGNDNEEYTTSAFCDGKGGYYAIMTLKRKLSKQGFTDRAEVVQSIKIEEAVLSLCKIFKPIGPTNFQFRMHNDVCLLLEINPRISSATSIRSAFGYNECLMAVEYYLDGKIPKQPKIKNGRAVRYIDDYIFYE